jgi:putative protease
MELLVPAGSIDSLKAAVAGGADAVYLGGKHFGARRSARNFSDDELASAVAFAHDNDVKVYVTANILIKEGELSRARSYIDLLQSIGADAVIVQDRGLLELIRREFSIPVHASTQMGIHTPEGARWAFRNGISRAILSRELSLDEIREVKEGSEMELEVFVHGALCYAFSGQCLFSSMLGGRSGNRGMCAQPCRKLYRTRGREGYLLSTADLFCIDSIPELMSIGVSSIKIEGRMRSPLYVYLVSKVYSAAIERARNGEELITPRERELLEVAFNRGYSTGYLRGMEVMQTGYPDSRGLSMGRRMFTSGTAEKGSDLLRRGDGITLYRGDEKVGGFSVSGDDLRSPFHLPDGWYEVYKTKDAEFDPIRKEIDMLDVPTVQAKRRSLDLELPTVGRKPHRPDLAFYLSSLRSLEAVLDLADRVVFDHNRYLDEAREMTENAGVEFVTMLPRLSPHIPEAEGAVMVNSLGQAERFADRKIFGSYHMNLFNSLTIPRFHQQTVSVELSKEDIADLCSHYEGRLEAMVFGRVELMVSRDPSLEEGTLIDPKGARFPVHRDRYGLVHILNSADMFLLDHLDELEGMGIDSFGIDLRWRDAELCGKVAKAYAERDMGMKADIKRRCGQITAGHYLRGVM